MNATPISANLPLNWKELQCLGLALERELMGWGLNRLIIPQHPLSKEQPEGYQKGEFLLQFERGRTLKTLAFRLMPPSPSLLYLEKEHCPKSAVAPLSVFLLTLQKQLLGKRVHRIVSFHRERLLGIWFSAPEEGFFGLVYFALPATPEVLLVTVSHECNFLNPMQWKLISRSRNTSEPPAFMKSLGQGPSDARVRETLEGGDIRAYSIQLLQIQDKQGLEARIEKLKKEVTRRSKEVILNLKKNHEQMMKFAQAPHWSIWGDVLKAELAITPKQGTLSTPRVVQGVPVEKGQTLLSQMEAYYQKARKQKLQEKEIQARSDENEKLKQQLDDDQKVIESFQEDLRLDTLIQLELRYGLVHLFKKRTGSTGSNGKKVIWDGKIFYSQEGLEIWVGRSREENLRLSLKVARGNDLWFHVKGRPGAHVVVRVPAGKSASLETLLDAAQLVLYYSQGKNWGKVEVDYTHCKYLKRIRDSTEVSYTRNKTLWVEYNDIRFQALQNRSPQ